MTVFVILEEDHIDNNHADVFKAVYKDRHTAETETCRLNETQAEAKARKQVHLEYYFEEVDLMEGKSATSGLKQQLDALSDDERKDVFGLYCYSCGSKDPRCQCWNDE